jgi:hypothetical protein
MFLRKHTISELYPELGNDPECVGCWKRKKELEHNEEAFDEIRDKIKKMVYILSSDYDDPYSSELNTTFLTLCLDVGINPKNMTKFYKDQNTIFSNYA